VILAVIAVPTVSTPSSRSPKPDDTECVINVTGQQWWWEYDYPVLDDGTICGYSPTRARRPLITSGQVVMPADTKVLIRGTSRDVIHSYWIPKLNGKRDMVPGRVHYLRLQSDTPASTPASAPSSAVSVHANMRMEMMLEPADFQRWLDNELEPYEAPEEGTLAAEGETVYVQQCARCHQVERSGRPAHGDPSSRTPTTCGRARPRTSPT
jgi:cytochrome c oxidase subunit II